MKDTRPGKNVYNNANTVTGGKREEIKTVKYAVYDGEEPEGLFFHSQDAMDYVMKADRRLSCWEVESVSYWYLNEGMATGWKKTRMILDNVTKMDHT